MTATRTRIWTFIISCLLVLTGCAGKKEETKTIRFAVTDIEGLEQLQLDFGPFKEALEEATGMPFEFFAVGSRTAVVEALKAGQVDIVMAGPAEYVVIAKRTQARPLVGFLRPDYTSAIITTKEVGIASLEDLRGKKVAFGDVGSTARHLVPMQMFADAGIDPLKDLEATHAPDAVIHESLKRGDVAAMAQSHGSWMKGLFAKEPKEIQDTFVVVAESEPLSPDVLVVRADMDDATFAKLREVFTTQGAALLGALSSTEENAKYKEASFVTDIDDSDYDDVRAMYTTAGFPEYSEFLD